MKQRLSCLFLQHLMRVFGSTVYTVPMYHALSERYDFGPSFQGQEMVGGRWKCKCTGHQ